MAIIKASDQSKEPWIISSNHQGTQKSAELEKDNEEAEKQAVLLQLDHRKFQDLVKPVKPKAVFSIGESTISTPGNITAISGQVKVGKSAFVEALVAAAMKPTAPERMLLGIRSCHNDGKAIVHFDTEQSRYDHHMLASRALERAGLQEQPQNLRSYCLTDVPHEERMKMLRFELERAESIFVVIIDGVADLLADPNDAESAFETVAELHKLAIQYDCPIICVLHENPGSDYGKTRGHLGSQLERKAETNLRLQKTDEITTIWSEKARHCNIPKSKGMRFKYSETQKMHILCDSLDAVKADAAREEMLPFAESLFENAHGVLGWKALKDKIIELSGIKAGGAEKKIKRLVDLKIISQNQQNKYVLTP